MEEVVIATEEGLAGPERVELTWDFAEEQEIRYEMDQSVRITHGMRAGQMGGAEQAMEGEGFIVIESLGNGLANFRLQDLEVEIPMPEIEVEGPDAPDMADMPKSHSMSMVSDNLILVELAEDEE